MAAGQSRREAPPHPQPERKTLDSSSSDDKLSRPAKEKERQGAIAERSCVKSYLDRGTNARYLSLASHVGGMGKSKK